jgi:DNA-binding XRE family transcriptional regulator
MHINSSLVRKLRKQRSWSQDQLARIAGVSVRTIQRVETDGSGSLETNMALASALEVPTIELACRPARRLLVGEWVGLLSGTTGAVIGLAYAWHGFLHWSGDDLHTGTAYGIMGAVSGVSCSLAGALVKKMRQRAFGSTREVESA